MDDRRVPPTSPAAVVVAAGGFVPPTVVTNDDLAARLDTSDEWIRSRSGIVTRHVAAPGVGTADLAVEAGAQALKKAGYDTVDVVVLATSTPDRACPATAPTVASRLGLGTTAAFDVDAVCSGFLYGLATTAGLLAAGIARTALLIGADTFTRFIDQDDRSTAFLFGDGAGALVLRAGDPGEPGAVRAFELGSDGTLADLITVLPGEAFSMQGQAVYRNAVDYMTRATRTVLDRCGWDPADLGLFIGHQANQRILDAVTARLKMPAGRAFSNVARVGNTAAASIPLALADADDAGLLHPGMPVALAAFGGGATWGAAALTWP